MKGRMTAGTELSRRISFTAAAMLAVMMFLLISAGQSKAAPEPFHIDFDTDVYKRQAPMSAWQVHVGYLVGGAMRAIVIGILLTAAAIPITGAPLEHPAELVVSVLLLTVAFGALGIIVGVYAQSWDNQSFINNIVILPLIFLGGVFYSVSRLGSPWEQISHFNPLFYVVDAVRYGFLGTSDVTPWISLAVVGAITLLLVTWSQVLFTTGHRLKP